MSRWRDLDRSMIFLYLAAALLPLMGLSPFILQWLTVPALPEGGLIWLFLGPPIPGFLLGAANLVRVCAGRPPKENAILWDALLLVSLLPDLALLGLDLLALAWLVAFHIMG